jgi:hypothetical protein
MKIMKIQNKFTVTTISLLFSLIFIPELTNSPAMAFSLNDNLQGYWQFNGNGNDSSENGRNLDIFGNPGFGIGLFGQALSVNGNPNKYAQRPINDPVFNFGNSDFTVQIWTKFHTTDDEQTLIEKFANQGGPGWTLTKLPDNVIRFYNDDNLSDGFDVDTAPLSISTGVFHNFVVRRQGDTFNIFFDDNLVVSNTFPSVISSTTNPLLIGKRNPSDGRDFPVNGLIDEVAIWNRAISDADIKYLYNSGKGNTISTPVPEPLTILGSGIALGFGGFLKRKLGKHQKD